MKRLTIEIDGNTKAFTNRVEQMANPSWEYVFILRKLADELMAKDYLFSANSVISEMSTPLRDTDGVPCGRWQLEDI